MTTPTGEELLWPHYAEPPTWPRSRPCRWRARGLPESTYALLARAATRWPDRTAITVLPDAARWREPLRRTFAELLADVHRYANLLHRLGVRRGDAVALMAPNCAELVTATLAAQLAGDRRTAERRPVHSGTSRSCCGAPAPGCSSRPAPSSRRRLGDRAGSRGRRRCSTRSWCCGPPPPRARPQPLPAVDGVRVGYLGELAAGMDPSGFAGDLPGSADLAGAVPHRRHHRRAEAGRAHPRQRGRRRLDAGRQLAVRRATRWSSPRCRCSTSTRWWSPCWRRCSRGSRWCGPARSATANPRCSASSGRSSSTTGSPPMSAVPTVYAVLARQPGRRRHQQPALRHGGRRHRCPPRSGTASRRAPGCTLVEGYGLTEATCASARSFPDAPRPGSVGQRLPYQRMKVVRVAADGTWQDLPAGATGVLAISGPTVFPGYVAGRGEHGHVLDGMGKLVDGWLDTGDLAARRRGRLRLPGRPRQGPDHPRRAQHRPGDRRGRAARPSPRHRGRARSAARTRTPARCPSPTSPSPPAPQ